MPNERWVSFKRKRMRDPARAVLLACGLFQLALALDNGLALRPPLAYSTWNFFNTNVNATLVAELGAALVSTGLAALGFTQLNIDSGYLSSRDPATGKLVANATNFPAGMRAVADDLNARGLKMGLYTDVGNGSCGITGLGSWGHYEQDAAQLAHEWHCDFLKVDFCGFGEPFSFQQWVDPAIQLRHWQMLRDALNATGRPMHYSICPHGHVPATGPSAPWYKNGTGLGYSPPFSWSGAERTQLANTILVEYTNLFDFWYAEHWQDFRTCGPTPQCPGCKLTPACHKSGPGGLLTNVDAMVALTKPAYSGPGSWADGDMLHVCNYGKGGADAGGRNDGGMTLEEYRASYSVYAVLASPIIISADLRSIEREHPACLAMLKNRELLAVHQDALAKPGALLRQRTNSSGGSSGNATRSTDIVEQVFSRELAPPAAGCAARAVVMFNRAEQPTNMTVAWAELGLPASGAPYSVRDVWAHNAYGADRGAFATGYTAVVPKHGVAMVTVMPARCTTLRSISKQK